MIKSTLVILSDNSTVILEPRVLCEISSVLCYEDQYFTWVLVVIGWLVAVLIAVWQMLKSRESSKLTSFNEWVREFREKIDQLEDDSFTFWTEKADPLAQSYFFTKAARRIKELTTIAKEIETVSTTVYPKELFIDLRQSITSDVNIDLMPLKPSSEQILKVKHTCISLRAVYKRKTS